MITTQVIRLTPSIAESLIARNDHNRPLRQGVVDMIARDMIEGRWELNGATLVVASTGRLLDGQHRLHAYVKAARQEPEIQIGVVLVDGVDESTFGSIDRGNRRSVADIIALDGYKNATTLSAGAVLSYAFDRTGDPFSGAAIARPSSSVIIEHIKSTPGLVKAASDVTGEYGQLSMIMQKSVACFCLHTFRRHDSIAANEFFRQIASGDCGRDGSPTLTLRNKLISSRLAEDGVKGSASSRGAKENCCILTFKAFRYFCSGASLRLLRIQSGESNLYSLV